MTAPTTDPRAERPPCGDCRVQPGERHDQGCDVARCISTGEQWIQCPGETHQYHGREYGEHAGICLPDIWTGVWPGEMEAIEFGWYCYFGPDYGEHGWVRVAASNPRARPDLNRINSGECVWSADKQRWLKR